MENHRFIDTFLMHAVLDVNGVFKTASSAWENYLKTEPSTLEGCLFLDNVHHEDRAKVTECLQEHGSYQGILRLQSDDKGDRWVSLHIQWDDTEAEFWISAQDETRHKAVELDLENARVYMESIVQTVREPLVVLDSESRIHLVNHAFYRTFQVTETETLGRLIDELGDGQWRIPGYRSFCKRLLRRTPVLRILRLSMNFQ